MEISSIKGDFEEKYGWIGPPGYKCLAFKKRIKKRLEQCFLALYETYSLPPLLFHLQKLSLSLLGADDRDFLGAK